MAAAPSVRRSARSGRESLVEALTASIYSGPGTIPAPCHNSGLRPALAPVATTARPADVGELKGATPGLGPVDSYGEPKETLYRADGHTCWRRKNSVSDRALRSRVVVDVRVDRSKVSTPGRAFDPPPPPSGGMLIGNSTPVCAASSVRRRRSRRARLLASSSAGRVGRREGGEADRAGRDSGIQRKRTAGAESRWRRVYGAALIIVGSPPVRKEGAHSRDSMASSSRR